LTHGYVSGGSAGPQVDSVRKYAFASDGNSVDGGADLSDGRHAHSGCSSETFGYVAGGYSSNWFIRIEKYSVSADSNSTDVGELSSARGYASPVGSQA